MNLTKLVLTSLTFSFLNLTTARASGEPVVVYLVSEPGEAELFQDDPVEPIDLEDENTFDDLLKQGRGEAVDKHYERLAEEARRQNEEFLALHQDFLNANFDPYDDDAIPEFIEIRKKISLAVFKSKTEKIYFQRLYLLNQFWLQNMEEQKRFESLDREMTEYWLSQQTRVRKIREIVVAVTTIGGAVLGGVGGFYFAKRLIPIKEGEKTLSLLARWAFRTPVILVGVGVGAAAGAYGGFLGSDYLFSMRREFLDPIDGDEDITDALDFVDMRMGLN